MDAEPGALPLGKGELLQDGTDVAIVAVGVTVWPAMRAAERLAKEGVSAAVVNARFVKPLDHGLIGEVTQKVRCLLTVEEAACHGGFGSAVLESLSDQGITNLPTKVLGLPDRFIEQGPQDLLREKYGLTAEGIYQSAKDLLARESSESGERYVASVRARPRATRGHVLPFAPGRGRAPDGDEQGS